MQINKSNSIKLLQMQDVRGADPCRGDLSGRDQALPRGPSGTSGRHAVRAVQGEQGGGGVCDRRAGLEKGAELGDVI